MRYLSILVVLGWALGCKSDRGQRLVSGRNVDSRPDSPIARLRPPCGPTEPCANWLIATPESNRGEEPARFAGSFRTEADRGSVYLDSAVAQTAQGPQWAPADSVVATLHRGERLVEACGLRGQSLDGRIVAVVRETTMDRYPTPRLAWQFDLDARRIRTVPPDSVYCEREYSGE